MGSMMKCAIAHQELNVMQFKDLFPRLCTKGVLISCMIINVTLSMKASALISPTRFAQLKRIDNATLLARGNVLRNILPFVKLFKKSHALPSTIGNAVLSTSKIAVLYTSQYVKLRITVSALLLLKESAGMKYLLFGKLLLRSKTGR